MNVAPHVAEVLSEHTALELECMDRLCLNAYVPMLQSGAGTAYFFRKIRGNPVPSSALMAPMTRRFVSALERYAQREGVDLIRFDRGERKDARTQAYLRHWHGGEGVLYIGKAQERARVLRTERRHDPVSGASYPWLASSTAMVNHYYVYHLPDAGQDGGKKIARRLPSCVHAVCGFQVRAGAGRLRSGDHPLLGRPGQRGVRRVAPHALAVAGDAGDGDADRRRRSPGVADVSRGVRTALQGRWRR